MSDNELASSADEGSDAEKAEALNAKVQRVMAPLMKKMTAKANAVYAHLLATHLLRTVLPQRAVD